MRLLVEMPKPELHLHLDGSLDPHLAVQLARTRDVDAPRDWAGMRAALDAFARMGAVREVANVLRIEAP